MSETYARSATVVSLAYLPPTPRQRHLVLLGAIFLLAAFGATAPFAAKPLPRLDAFIPTVEGIIFVNDLITSVLLFGQYSVTRSRAVLALASGYLFTALTVVVHVLSFPGAFAPRGLLEAGLQTAPWIYYFWHLGFPIAVLAYVWLRWIDSPNLAPQESMSSKVGWCVAIVFSVVSAFAWLATAGERFLPRILVDDLNTQQWHLLLINSTTLLVVVIVLTILWIRRASLLDYWLLLVLLTIVSELVLSNLLNNVRFSLGYYAGRVFSLATSIFVLGLLLQEMTRLYTSLARSNLLLERERNNKLMNVEATTAAIAHEIRQPLTAILANAQSAVALLEQELPDLPEAKDALEEIVAAGFRTRDALEGIRSMFRATNNDRESVDINEMAIEVLRVLRGELRANEIVVQPQLTSSLSHVSGNRGQLHQLIFNLVHNAIEAMVVMTHRKRVLSLTTDWGDRNTIVVAVRDSGPGIDPNRLSGIFDAFETTKSQGMGLGLAICRLIVERHGGKLSAYSDGKSGALFQVVLPIDPFGTAARSSQFD